MAPQTLTKALELMFGHEDASNLKAYSGGLALPSPPVWFKPRIESNHILVAIVRRRPVDLRHRLASWPASDQVKP